MLADAPNIQSLWGDLIVEELIRNGVRHFVVCPGSRSTPLVQAVARNPKAIATSWVDERGAGFFALGGGRGSWGPYVVVTTSGTAVANLLPAVVEASLEGVPLILLTADRPPELREVGANQSINQIGIFSDHVRWSVDLPAPTTDMPARALLSTIDEAVFRAEEGHMGPVHVNCPFREPLAPSQEPWDPAWLEALGERWLDEDAGVWLTLHAGDPVETGEREDVYLPGMIRETEHGIIVCGALPSHADRAAVTKLANRIGWPLWPDIRSGLRVGPAPASRCLHLDRILAWDGTLRPDVVLQFGGRITSKRMQAWLDAGPELFHVLVDPEPSRLDPGHVVTCRYRQHIAFTCEQILSDLADAPLEFPPLDLADRDAHIEAAASEAVEAGDEASEAWVARWLSRHMIGGHALFVSNSMPIRDVQAFADADGPERLIYANRGASGIDGITSTAAGCAQGRGVPVTLLTGDLALLHDANALAMLNALKQPLTIVAINNGGGGIFSFLPIAEHEDVLRPYVETPHDIRFEGVCQSFGLPYAHVDTRAGFEQAYKAAIESGRSSVIEVASDIAGNKAHHDRIEAAIASALKNA